MPSATGELSISRDDGDRGRVQRFAYPRHDPVVRRGSKLKPQLGSFTALRVLGRTSAIEDEPDLSVRIREAPGESDQALAHGFGPEWSWSLGACGFGGVVDRIAWVLGLIVGFASVVVRAERSAVEGVVSIDQPQPRFWERVESAS